MALRIFSFFSGSGFLDLGFEESGFQMMLVNEFSESFMNAYVYSRKKMNLPKPTFGYINDDVNVFLGDRFDQLQNWIVQSREDKSLVGFIGGPPCPDFSVAGKQKGRNGDNGKLSQSYIDLIIRHHPDFFLFENVKGLWKTKKHRMFYEELKNQLQNNGYTLTEKLVNSLEYGVPQDRERILLFGISNELVNIYGDLREKFAWRGHAVYDLARVKSLPWPTVKPFAVDDVIPCPEGIIRELTVQYWFEKNHVEQHPNSIDCFTPRGGIERMRTVQEGDDSKKSYKRIHRWRYSPTVAYGNNEVHLHPYKERRLNAAEAMSLQSLPELFELPPNMSLTDKFKTIGNGVPYLLAKGVAESIHDYFCEG